MRSPDPVIGIAQTDDPPRGGLGRSLVTLAEALRACGMNVRVLGAERTSRMPGAHIADRYRRVRQLPAFVRDQGITHLLYVIGPGGLPSIPPLPGIKKIAIVYHTYQQQSRLVPGQRWKRMFMQRESAMLRSADRIVCHAADSVESVRKYGIDPDRIALLPHVVDLRPWTIDVQKERGLCVCVSRLERRKNVEAVVRSWPLVRKRVPYARLTIVGDGVLRSRIDRLIGTDASIRRIDRLDAADLRSLAARADVALCPSHLEGFGLACVEAMAAGTAVVANDAEGLRNLVDHGSTGFLADADDGEAWSNVVADLLLDRQKRFAMADRARKAVTERFAVDGAVRAHTGAITSS